jgi:hypothetical protein
METDGIPRDRWMLAINIPGEEKLENSLGSSTQEVECAHPST